MAPSYENLPLEDDEFDESQIDFADIEEQFQVRLDEGLDAFVVIDGLPVVPEDSKGKLVKFVLRKLNTVGKVKDEGVHMPVGDHGKTEGYVWRGIPAASMRTVLTRPEICLCRVQRPRRGCRRRQAAARHRARQEAHHGRQQAHRHRPLRQGGPH